MMMHHQMNKKDSTTTSLLPYLNTSNISWGGADSIVRRGGSVSISKSLSLKGDTKQDSSSTHSTDQSYTEVATSGDNYDNDDDTPSRQISFSTKSRYEETPRNGFGANPKSGVMTEFPNIHFAPANFSFGYADPHLGGLLSTTYLPHAPICNPQMMGMVPGRVPLPVEVTETEPVFVNAKQYHAIMRRRQQRAKLEAQNKIIKARKPYLHESRHVHALKRPRGSGGRFLNTKKILQESEQAATRNANMSRFEAYTLHNNSKGRSSTTSSSDITSVSDGADIFGQFTNFQTPTNRAMIVHNQSNDMHGGGGDMHHHFSVHI